MILRDSGLVQAEPGLWRPVDRFRHRGRIEYGSGLLLEVPLGGYPVAADKVAYCVIAGMCDGHFIYGIVNYMSHSSREAEVEFHEGTGSVEVIVSQDTLLSALRDYRLLIAETKPDFGVGAPPSEWYCECLDRAIRKLRAEGIAGHMRGEFDYSFDHVGKQLLDRV